MSIDTALKSALTGLKASQKNLAVISSNIANANTEGYSRRVVDQSVLVVNGEGVGTEVKGVDRVIDQFALQELRSQNSSVGYAQTLSNYYQEIQRNMGQPDAENSLNGKIDKFFSVMEQLSNNVELPSLRTTAVNGLVDLVGSISSTARSLEELRFKADSEISNAVDFVNHQIDRLYELNTQIRDNLIKQAPVDALQEERDNILNKLGEYVNVSVAQKSDGRIIVSTGSGTPLLDDSRYHLGYNKANSANTFIDGDPLNALTITPIDADGQPFGVPTNLASGGVRTDITSSLKDGKIKALLELRDYKIPSVLDQLDQLTRQLTDSLNAIHNEGVGFPPASELTGETKMVGTDSVSFSGSVRFAILDQNGQPVPSPYPDLGYYPPLTVNLSELTSGTVPGQFNTATFINEFNAHFQAPPTRVSIGNLFNVQLAATTSVINPGNNFSFNFDLENYSGKPASFEVLGVSVSGGGSVTSAIPFSNSYNINSGDKTRTDSSHAVTVALGSGAGPHTIDVTMRVSDGNGGFVTDTVRYTLDDASGVLNRRYPPTAVIAPTSASIIPGSSGEVARAVFVNDKGEEISPTGTEAGHLKLIAGQSTYTLAIDELDSKQIGWPSDPAKPGTERGFSHFFGLNNLLDSGDSVAGAAINLKVRDDIAHNANLLSLGKLTRTLQSNDPNDIPTYSYEVGSGSNEIAKKIASLKDQPISFGATDTLSKGDRSLSSYTVEIVAYTASYTNLANANLKQENLLMEGFKERFESTSGVNIDEELAKTIFFQNAYTASAKVITVASKLFDVLMDTIN